MAIDSSWLADLLAGIRNIVWNGTTFPSRNLVRLLGSGVVSVVDNGTLQSTDVTLGGGGSNGNFGDTSDGTVTCDGASAVAGMTRSGSTYTLTRDVFFLSLTVNAGVTIIASGWRLFALTLVLNGTVQWDGASAAGASPPATASGISLGNGAQGGSSGAGGSSSGALGGAGGQSAWGVNNNAGGAVTYPSGQVPLCTPDALRATQIVSTGSVFKILGGGGGGGVASSNDGGAGGGNGGNVVMVAAGTLSGTGLLSAKGGNGITSITSHLYGSGGGGGGVLFLVTRDKTNWTGTVSVAGGLGGAGSLNQGSAGVAGRIVTLNG